MAIQNNHFKIEYLCRTCLSKEIEMISVFDVCLGTITLDNIIASITGLKIEKGDGLPSTICNSCKQKAANAFDFRSRSQEAETTLRQLLNSEKIRQSSKTDDSLLFEPDAVEVKIENYTRDNHDDYIDLDLSLALTSSDSFDNEVIKDELDTKCKVLLPLHSTEPKKEDGDSKKKIKFVHTDGSESTYCPVCAASFEDAEGLTKHVWDRHAELMGPKKRGRPKKLLTSTILHKLSENGINIKYLPRQKHNCIFCKDDFKTKDDLVIHLIQHRDIKVLSCLLCKKMYLEMKHFESHICIQTADDTSTLNSGEPPDIAVNEPKINLSTEVLLRDMLTTNGEMESASFELCDECGAFYTSSAELGKHTDREHPELSTRCHLCDKVFATVKSAARHRAVCQRVERLFGCSSCGLRFAHEVSLNKHILRVHTGQSVSVRFMDNRAPPQHRCDTCNRRFYRKDLLARHAKIHKSSDKCFECDVCNKTFNRRDNLKTHMRIHESGPSVDGPSSSASLCLYCGRSFSNSSNLIVHMRRHTGEKPYKCDFCGKGFPRSSDLQCHRRSHTGEKPCICGVCGKAFARSNKLSRHMRVHTGMKPYKCPYCEKAFSQSNDLKLHVRRHTGDKPYVCELCGDRFIQGTALHNHRRAHGHYPTSAAQTLAPIVYTVQSITQTH